MQLSNALQAPFQPAPVPPAPVPPHIPEPPPYIIENRKQALGPCCPEGLRYVRVARGVGTITNGVVMLRFMAAIPNGLYTITETNHMRAERPSWIRYPDVEMAEPPFETMRPLAQVPNTQEHPVLGQLLVWVSSVCERGGNVVFTKTGCYMKQWPECSFGYPFGLAGETSVDAQQLKLALKERMIYDLTIISREEHRTDRITPLVFGQNWAQCSLLMPLGHCSLNRQW